MNMNHIDITFDMETCATTANAAVMQVAAVAWNRSAKENPFFWCEIHTLATFNEHIDLRSCVVDGFDFDQATIKWWANQTDKAKKAVKEEKTPIKIWKYEPGKGSHVVFETEKPKTSK